MIPVTPTVAGLLTVMEVLSWTPALLAWLGEMMAFETLVTRWLASDRLALLEVVVREQEPPAGASVTLTA